MIKTIGLIPTFINQRNSNNILVDYNLINFIEKCFPNCEIKILLDNNFFRRKYTCFI